MTPIRERTAAQLQLEIYKLRRTIARLRQQVKYRARALEMKTQ